MPGSVNIDVWGKGVNENFGCVFFSYFLLNEECLKLLCGLDIELTTEGERLFPCGMVRGKRESVHHFYT